MSVFLFIFLVLWHFEVHLLTLDTDNDAEEPS